MCVSYETRAQQLVRFNDYFVNCDSSPQNGVPRNLQQDDPAPVRVLLAMSDLHRAENAGMAAAQTHMLIEPFAPHDTVIVPPSKPNMSEHFATGLSCQRCTTILRILLIFSSALSSQFRQKYISTSYRHFACMHAYRLIPNPRFSIAPWNHNLRLRPDGTLRH